MISLCAALSFLLMSATPRVWANHSPSHQDLGQAGHSLPWHCNVPRSSWTAYLPRIDIPRPCTPDDATPIRSRPVPCQVSNILHFEILFIFFLLLLLTFSSRRYVRSI